MLTKENSSLETRFEISRRRLVEICTDPQRRCYDGCFFKSEIAWTDWEVMSHEPASRVDPVLKFWRELNAYAVGERGSVGTLCEFRGIAESPQ